MKILPFILIIICFSKSIARGQLVDREEDISEEYFNKNSFKNLDADFAMELLNQQAKTMVTSLANKAAAAAPFVGTAGVAMEVGMSNLKLDELIVANKNYNYKLTAVLGNILKITKEARDGTMASRAKNAARKVEIIDESIKAIRKCERTRDILKTLGEKGWTTTNMLRAINAIDGTLEILEKIGKKLLRKTNSMAEETQALNESEKILEDMNKMLDEAYANAMKELNEKIASKYSFEYNSALITGAMYMQDITKEEGQEKYNFNISRSKNLLVAFKNIMWMFVIIFFLVGGTANVWKVFFDGDNSIAFIRNTKAWYVGLAVCIILSGMLEKALIIIYN